jgi:hypothetical protein
VFEREREREGGGSFKPEKQTRTSIRDKRKEVNNRQTYRKRCFRVFSECDDCYR